MLDDALALLPALGVGAALLWVAWRFGGWRREGLVAPPTLAARLTQRAPLPGQHPLGWATTAQIVLVSVFLLLSVLGYSVYSGPGPTPSLFGKGQPGGSDFLRDVEPVIVRPAESAGAPSAWLLF